MAFYFRGLPDFVPSFNDLTRLSALPVDTVSALCDLFSSYPGFLSQAVAKRAAEEGSVCSGEDATLVYDLIQRLRVVRQRVKKPTSVEDIFLGNPAKRQKSDGPSVSDADRLKIEERLSVLDRAYPAIERQEKADRLADAVGLRSEGIDLICDLRPIFDDQKDQLLGILPLTTLKIVASGVDQFPINFEVVLSASDVLALQTKVTEAVKKLNKLGEFVANISLVVPDVELTQTNQESE